MSLVVQNLTIPQESYKPDFEKGLFAREYNSIFQNGGIKITNEGNCISKKLFAGGCYLQIFDLSPDNCGGFHQHAPEYGDVGINISFARQLDEPITVLLYGIFDAEVHIGGDKLVRQAVAAQSPNNNNN